MSGGNFGNITSGIGNLVGSAADIYSLFQGAPKTGGNKPFTGVINTPGYSLGGGNLVRRNQDFIQGQRRLRDLYGSLRQEVRPGYGRLTESGVNAIRQRAAQASGNLRSQLNRRGLSGASFAEDQLSRVEQEYNQAEAEFRNQAFLAETQATNELLDREYASLTTQAAQELQELNVSTGFLAGVNQVAQSQKSIEAAIKQMKLLEQMGTAGTA